MGNLKEAIIDYRAAIKHEPESVQSRIDLSEILVETGEFDEAKFGKIGPKICGQFLWQLVGWKDLDFFIISCISSILELRHIETDNVYLSKEQKARIIQIFQMIMKIEENAISDKIVSI